MGACPWDARKVLPSGNRHHTAVVTHGVLCYVNHHQFEVINQKFKLRERVASPYALAGRVCASLADRWKDRHHPNESPVYVFEDGGPDKGGLINAMKLAPALDDPMFEPSRDITDPRGRARKGVIQLQAADFFAYELRKARVERFDRTNRPVRQSFYRLLGVQDLQWPQFTPEVSARS